MDFVNTMDIHLRLWFMPLNSCKSNCQKEPQIGMLRLGFEPKSLP